MDGSPLLAAAEQSIEVVQPEPEHRPPAALGFDRAPPGLKEGDDVFEPAIVAFLRDLCRGLRLFMSLGESLVNRCEVRLGVERVRRPLLPEAEEPPGPGDDGRVGDLCGDHRWPLG